MAEPKTPLDSLRSLWLAEVSDLMSDEKKELPMPLKLTSETVAREICIAVTSLVSDVIRDALKEDPTLTEDVLKQRATAAGVAAVAAILASFSSAGGPAAPQS